MKKYSIICAAIGLTLLTSAPALAEWTVIKNSDFVGGGYKVLDKDSGREMNTKFNTKRGAKAAAKALNAADKLADKNDGE